MSIVFLLSPLIIDRQWCILGSFVCVRCIYTRIYNCVIKEGLGEVPSLTKKLFCQQLVVFPLENFILFGRPLASYWLPFSTCTCELINYSSKLNSFFLWLRLPRTHSLPFLFSRSSVLGLI